MSSQQTIKIAELVDSGEANLQTGPFGTQLKASDYSREGTPVINVRNIGFGDIRENDLEFLDERMVEKLSAHELQKEDIVFGRKGAVERHAFIGEIGQGWIQGSDCLRLRIKSKRIDNQFISYFLRTQAHQDWMMAVCSFGATMASLNQDIVKLISIPLLPLATQRKIAAILSAYDELIENNRRRIGLLEQIAEELYREWFVRFRFPNHQTTPFKKGIPQGWKGKPLSELADINARSLKRTSNLEFIDYVDIGSVTTGRINETTTYHRSEAPGRAKRLVQHGDILWSSVRPANRAYSVVLHPKENMVASTGFAVISPKEPRYFPFLYQATTTDAFVDQITMVAKGAAYPATSFDDFEKTNILVPPSNLIEDFFEKVNPMFEQLFVLGKENTTLTRTKEALLPRLISGALSVKELDIALPPGME
jgi:type I restriction enzyme S subunit